MPFTAFAPRLIPFSTADLPSNHAITRLQFTALPAIPAA